MEASHETEQASIAMTSDVQALLSALEQGGAAAAPQQATTPSESESTSSDAGKQRPPMRNASRERMKAETSFLRTRVTELERQLSQLLAKNALARCTAPSPVWRDMAKRQIARRERSLNENLRLKAKLRHQIQVAKSLETIFLNRSGAFLEQVESHTAFPTQNRYPVHDLAALHTKFLEEIDDIFRLVDTIFATPVSPQDAVDQGTMRRSTVVTQQADGNEQLHVELRDVTYVPFAFDRVCKATWVAITTEYNRQNRLIEQFRCTEDEYTCRFFASQGPTPSGNLLSCVLTMRKFVQPHRMVVIWRSLNIEETGNEQREYSDESGWLVVERVQNAITEEPCEESAIVQVCTRYVPTWNERVDATRNGLPPLRMLKSADPAVGEFTQRILAGTEEDIASITESIENILLDESINSSDTDEIGLTLDELSDMTSPVPSMKDDAVGLHLL